MHCLRKPGRFFYSSLSLLFCSLSASASLISTAEKPLYLQEWMIVIYIVAGTLFCSSFYVCILLCRCFTSGKSQLRRKEEAKSVGELAYVSDYELNPDWAYRYL